MNGPLIFSFFALVHGCIALLALILSGAMLLPALCLFVVEAVTAFDNGATVLGNRLGIGEHAQNMSRMRFLLHATCIAFLLPIYSSIGGIVAFSQFGSIIVNLISWLLVVLIGIYGYHYQYQRIHFLMPVNYFGCLRYAQSISDSTRHPDYEYSQQELSARAGLPVASVMTIVSALLLSLLIGWFGAFWMPFVVTSIMFIAAGLPQRGWGPLVTSCLEVIFSAGLLYSLWHVSALLV
ncbi:MAG: hypothetical protein GY727_15745 [Gammaproteobacteria bacterium]|nr:hypothetical protein [Gammaproteobacteria bacterium]MCP4089095.1 hypothetical protein [Gammaproteobacteria bacterium]MCP4276880.1 hypothetical protein [Gammaproteobacteria bacterium]MCP4830723.1 hypothetical protein [Gammaproteobacteria bacterium]